MLKRGRIQIAGHLFSSLCKISSILRPTTVLQRYCSNQPLFLPVYCNSCVSASVPALLKCTGLLPSADGDGVCVRAHMPIHLCARVRQELTLYRLTYLAGDVVGKIPDHGEGPASKLRQLGVVQLEDV